MTQSELFKIKKSLINIKAALKLNTQARQLLSQEFERQVARYQEHLESQIGEGWDKNLSNKLDALAVLLGGR